MDTATKKGSDDAQIRQLVDEWKNALRAKDIDRMMANYSPNILVFGVTPPLQYKGANEYRKKWEEMFNATEGPIALESRDVDISASGDFGLMHCLKRITAKMKGSKGDDEGSWMRVTVCFRNIDGRWLVTHEHVSVPFDPTTGKASIDLKP
jgi:uncharacterized protein (TIGR02246 family)